MKIFEKIVKVIVWTFLKNEFKIFFIYNTRKIFGKPSGGL